MSNKMEHLNLDTIQSYLEGLTKQSELPEIEGHLATCKRCYSIYMELKSVETPLSRSFKEEKATAYCPEDWEIGALLKGETPQEISKKITAHLKDCSFCMERAAGCYKSLEPVEKTLETPELWKHKAVQALKAERRVKETEVPLLQRISAFFQKLSVPFPPLPGYVTAALAILVLIIWNVLPQQEKIVTIASSEKVITRDSEIPSAFGFMGVGESREVKDMEIFHEGKDIVFKWKPVEGAVGYEFSLRDRSETVYSSSIDIDKDTRVSLKKDLMERDRLYSWLITGKTPDGKYFEYTGDFLLVK